MNYMHYAGALSLVGITTVATVLGTGAVAQQQPRAQQQTTLKDIVPQLTVRGEAQLDKPADQMHVRLGVVTQATEAAQAIELNNRTMNDVIAAIEKLGLTKQEYQTGSFNVQPQYSQPPRNREVEWRPEITGYQVNNTLQIKTKKIDMAGQIIQGATNAGANTVDSISFDLADRQTHRAEAIAAATENAMADARALAQAAGQRLVRVIAVNLDGADSPVPMYRHEMMMGREMAADAGMVPPIQPGDVTVRASVTMAYEIAPMN